MRLLTQMYLRTKKNRLNCGSYPAADSDLEIFRKCFQHCDHTFFLNLVHISGETAWISMKIFILDASLDIARWVTMKTGLSSADCAWIVLPASAPMFIPKNTYIWTREFPLMASDWISHGLFRPVRVKIFQIIDQIFAAKRGSPLNILVWTNLYTQHHEIWPKNIPLS